MPRATPNDPIETAARGRPVPATAPDLAVLAGIVVVGTALRLYFLGEPMRSDEAYTYTEYASRSLYDAVSLYTFPNNHLLHTALVHVSVRTLGAAPWAVRLPALLAGAAMIPGTFVMARTFAGPLAGLFAAALVASSDILVSYSVNARGYTLLGLITVLLVAVAGRVAVEGRPRDWLALTLLPPLGFFTVPVMLYPYGGVLSWLVLALLFGRARGVRFDRLFLSGLVAGALTLLLYAPAVIRTGAASVVANKFVAPRPFGEVAHDLPGSLLEVWDQWNLDVPKVLTVLFLASWLAAVLSPSPVRAGVRALTGLVVTTALSSLAVVLYQSVVPFDRVWLFGLPLYLGCVGSGLAAVAGWAARARVAVVGPALALALCALLSFLVATSPEIPKDSARLTVNHGGAMVKRLRSLLGSDDAVITELPCEGPLKYYFMLNGMPVEPLYDYRVARARRLYIVVNRPNKQTPESVLVWNHLATPPGRAPRLVEDFGLSALYALDRW
jgi:hypothetical protein